MLGNLSEAPFFVGTFIGAWYVGIEIYQQTKVGVMALTELEVIDLIGVINGAHPQRNPQTPFRFRQGTAKRQQRTQPSANLLAAFL